MPASRHHRLLGGAALAAVALLAAGCGGASDNGESAKAASQIYTDARNATSTLSSLHVKGTIAQGEQTLGLDLYDGKGAGGGTLSINGAPLQVVVAGGNLYLKGTTAVWQTLTSSGTDAAALGGKWLETSSNDTQFGNLLSLVEVDKLVTSFTPQGKLTKSAGHTYQGQPAVGLSDSGGGKGTLYVASTGKPYILGIDGAGQGNINFDQFGTAQLPGVPSGSVSLSQVEQSLGG